jgi:hypothetical protein
VVRRDGELRAHQQRLDPAEAEEDDRREEEEEADPLVVDGRQPAEQAGPLLPDAVEPLDLLGLGCQRRGQRRLSR